MASSSSIIEDLANITLEDEDEGGLICEEASKEVAFEDRWCLVGRFITDGAVDFLAMQHTLASLWKPGRGVYIKELDANRFLFQFYHEIDVSRVLSGSPWSFNRKALILARLKKGENPRTVALNSMELWIQIHDLSPGYMTEKVLQGVGNYIGTFVESDDKNFMGVWRDYMCIRVSVDLNKPLKRKMKLKKTDTDWIWINFKYENVPTFCFICGLLGHSEKFCARLFDTPAEKIVKPYGIWMKAPFRKQVKPIGAKWLRSGEGIGGEGVEGISQNAPQGMTGGLLPIIQGNITNSAIVVTETNHSRDNSGIRLTEPMQISSNSGGENGFLNVKEGNDVGLVGIEDNEEDNNGLNVVDPKRRRLTQLQGKGPNEKTDTEMIQFENECPKNMQKAGLEVGVRLQS